MLPPCTIKMLLLLLLLLLLLFPQSAGTKAKDRVADNGPGALRHPQWPI